MSRAETSCFSNQDIISVCLTKLSTLVSNISWKKSRRHENYAVKEGNEVPKTLKTSKERYIVVVGNGEYRNGRSCMVY